MRHLKEYYVTLIVILIVIIINIAAVFLYFSNIRKDIEHQTENHLTELMDEASTCVELKVEETLHELEMTAFYIGMQEGNLDAQVLNIVKSMTKKSGFDSFDIVDSQGTGLEENGSKDYTGTKMYKKVKKNNIYVVDTKDSEGNSTGTRFAVPIVNSENQVIGIYLADCSLDRFTKLLDLDSISTKGKTFIIKTDGTVLSCASGSSIKTVNDILNNDKNVKKLKSYMKSKKSGVIGFAKGKNAKRYICYSKTNFNSWEIITVISSSGVEANISDVTGNFVVLGITMGGMLAVLIGYFIYSLAHAQTKISVNLRRYYMVAKNTEDVIFDYSCVKDTMYCNDSFEKFFGYEPPREEIKEHLGDVVYTEDIQTFKNAINEMKKTGEMVEFLCRILDKDREPVPCICKILGIKDNLRKLIKIVGVIEKCSNEEG